MRHDAPWMRQYFRFLARTLALLDEWAAARPGARNVPADRTLGEALRVEHHPLISFREGAAGRRQPVVIGTRLAVHQVIATLQAHGDEIDQTAAYLAAVPRQVRAAREYYADFQEEVDADAATAERTARAERDGWERQ